MKSHIEQISLPYVTATTEGSIFRETVQQTRNELGAAVCQVLMRDPDGDYIPRASAPPTFGEARDINPQFFELAYTNRDPFIIDDITDKRSSAAAASVHTCTPGLRSVLIHPLDSIGVFVAGDRTPAAFTEADIQLIRPILAVTEAATKRIRSQTAGGAQRDRLVKAIATFSHDIRNPLQVAKGNLKLAERKGSSSYFEKTEAALTRIEELLEDMSRFAETGQPAEIHGLVDLRTAAERAWTTVASEDATLEIHDTCEFAANMSRFCQLLENLFQNAIDHGASDAHVRIDTLETGFYVEDDGDGLPDAIASGLFEEDAGKAGGHSGLGLVIVKDVVEEHGWNVALTESEMGGARFEVTNVI